MQISEKASQALYGAAVKRGTRKGLLLRNPPQDKLARAAWYGAQSVCNPYKLSIGWLMFASSEEREIYHEVEKIFDWLKIESKGAIVKLDQDRATLEQLGAW